MIKAAFLIFVLSFAFASTIQARVMEMVFDDLIEDADLIVIGKVESINHISDVRIAKFKISQTLKGTATDEIYFLAERTWTCDISDARVGEKALLFLSKYNYLSKLEIQGIEKPDFKLSFEKITYKTELFRIYGSGYGREPIRNIKGKDYISVPVYQIKVPKELLEDKSGDWTLQDKYADLNVISDYINYRLENPRYYLFVDLVAEPEIKLETSLGFFEAFEKLKNTFF